jgi:hypothetical protein
MIEMKALKAAGESKREQLSKKKRLSRSVPGYIHCFLKSGPTRRRVQHLSSLCPCLTPWCDVPFGPSQLHYENNELHTSGLIGHPHLRRWPHFLQTKAALEAVTVSDDPEGARFAAGFFIAYLAQYPMSWKGTF